MIENKILNVKKLADSDSEEDTISWVNKTKTIQEEMEIAKKKVINYIFILVFRIILLLSLFWTDFSAMFLFCQKAQELEEMDNVFGVGDLIEESTKNEMKNFYSSKHLKGLEVQHSMVYNNFNLCIHTHIITHIFIFYEFLRTNLWKEKM